MGRTARSLLVLGPARADLAPAARIAASLAVPLVVLLATDRIEWSLFASFGAFTSIYARYVPPRTRVRQQTVVGLLLVCCVALGALIARTVGTTGPEFLHLAITAVAGALVAAVSSVLIMDRGLRPAGAVFPVFATTAVASVPSSAGVLVAAAIAAASAAWCVLLGYLARWTGEANPDAAEPVLPTRSRLARRQEFSRYGLAALAAGAIASLTGLTSPYWAQVAAVVPLSAPGRRQQLERGLHRILGTVIGVALAGFLLSFPSQPWQLLVWVVLLQFLAEMFVLRNYSLALLFITPLALLMVQLAHPRPTGQLLVARVAETSIGAVVGIVIVLIAVALERRRHADTSAPSA